MKMTHRRHKQRATVVVLLPELIEMNMVDWTRRMLELTGCKSLVEYEIAVDREDVQWLSPHRGAEYRQLTAEHLEGKIVKILVIKGEDVVRRVRQIVGKQDDPNDWPPYTIRGQLRQLQKPQEIMCRQTVDGKRYYWPFLICPKTHTAAKRLLKRLKVYFGKDL